MTVIKNDWKDGTVYCTICHTHHGQNKCIHEESTTLRNQVAVLREALFNLKSECINSVEYGDWLELQRLVENAESALEQTEDK